MKTSDDPSPEEIRRLCWAIQSTWTEKERLRRCGWTTAAEEVLPRVVSTAGIDA